jgi:hypothetical protein
MVVHPTVWRSELRAPCWRGSERQHGMRPMLLTHVTSPPAGDGVTWIAHQDVHQGPRRATVGRSVGLPLHRSGQSRRRREGRVVDDVIGGKPQFLDQQLGRSAALKP